MRIRPTVLALLAGSVGVAGCSVHGADSLPLPGGVSGETYPVTIVFDDATNLLPRETCRSNDVTIGTISSITVDSQLKARVVCRIKKSAVLPTNSVAAIETTSLLGERFVAIEPPTAGAAATALGPGAVINAGNTRTDPDTEQVLGALSAVLNGGDIARLGSITTELNKALGGRESDVRGLINQLTALTGTLSAHTGEITHALDAVDHLTATLARQRSTLGAAIDTVPAGLAVLNRQRSQLVSMLGSVQNLSRTAVPLINESGSQLTTDLRLMGPTLHALASNGQELARALRTLSTYPLPANAVNAASGDYAGLYVTFNLDANSLAGLLSPSATSPASSTSTPVANQQTPSGTTATSDGLSGLLSNVLPPQDPSAPILTNLLTGILGGTK